MGGGYACNPRGRGEINYLGTLLVERFYRLKARKKLVEAEEVQQRAVTIAENVYGPDHPQVCFCFPLRRNFLHCCPLTLPCSCERGAKLARVGMNPVGWKIGIGFRLCSVTGNITLVPFRFFVLCGS